MCARTEGACEHDGVYTRVWGGPRRGSCWGWDLPEPATLFPRPAQAPVLGVPVPGLCRGGFGGPCAGGGSGGPCARAVPAAGLWLWDPCASAVPWAGVGVPVLIPGDRAGVTGLGGRAAARVPQALWHCWGSGSSAVPGSAPPSQPCVCSSLGAGGGPGEARAGCGCGACNPLRPGAQLCCSSLLSPRPPEGSPPGTGTQRGCIHPSPPPRSSPGIRTPRRRCSTCCPRRWWHVTCASTPRPGSRTALSACGQRSWAARCQVGACCLLPLAPTHECPGTGTLCRGRPQGWGPHCSHVPGSLTVSPPCPLCARLAPCRPEQHLRLAEPAPAHRQAGFPPSQLQGDEKGACPAALVWGGGGSHPCGHPGMG